ncbi:hypothetical protein DPMN_121530 [Dreissena polymorpha]|uniref:Uncharacterized protein n=1 Tax=Dreissena polymorpha TaxID=45954 RepID=A0A9D4JPL6_DREPO|nr:hypothetical protein DPMN_121530 [Dreissena polymorpha]
MDHLWSLAAARVGTAFLGPKIVVSAEWSISKVNSLPYNALCNYAYLGLNQKKSDDS